jgi:hypothetical protein
MSPPANIEAIQRHEAIGHWNNLRTNASFRWFAEVFLQEQIDLAATAIVNGTADKFDVNQAKMKALEEIQRECTSRIN